MLSEFRSGSSNVFTTKRATERVAVVGSCWIVCHESQALMAETEPAGNPPRLVTWMLLILVILTGELWPES